MNTPARDPKSQGAGSDSATRPEEETSWGAVHGDIDLQNRLEKRNESDFSDPLITSTLTFKLKETKDGNE